MPTSMEDLTFKELKLENHRLHLQKTKRYVFFKKMLIMERNSAINSISCIVVLEVLGVLAVLSIITVLAVSAVSAVIPVIPVTPVIKVLAVLAIFSCNISSIRRLIATRSTVE